MCGIVGIYNRSSKPFEQSVLEKMAKQIVHRGPDDFGYHIEGNVGLGFRRLSIIDLEGGHQPLSNEDGTVWISFNGEIYNYQEIKKSLVENGHQFKTDSDTEVIVHLYEEKGVDCVKELRGMFCFAIHDMKKDIVMVARDHFGIKPCYYTKTEESFAWASEIKSLLQLPGFERKVNKEALWNYFTFQYAPDPLTMFENVYKLPAAHYMLIQNGEVSIQKYWQLTFDEKEMPISYYIEGTKDVLRDSVKAHMNSDVPRGAFLSSGVDSSTIVSLLRELEEVKTFTVGFEGAGGQSEIAFARETAKLLKTEHHDTIITAKEYLEVLPKLMMHQDEPVADPSAIALYFVSELASPHITVVLSGEGADEIFGGYTIYREPNSLRMFDYLPEPIKKTLGRGASLLPEGIKGRSFLMRGSKNINERFVGNAFIFGEEAKEELLKLDREALKIRRYVDITKPYYDFAKEYPGSSKMQFVDFHTWLPGDILMKADKMTMANSLELRVPFLDRKVFDFASQIPEKYRFINGTTKHVLREAAKDILPKEVAERPKLGFPVPTRVWLRGEHYEWAKQIIETSRTEHLINKRYVLRLLEEHKNGEKDNARKVWTVLMFMLWHQIYIEGTISITPEVSSNVELRRRK